MGLNDAQRKLAEDNIGLVYFTIGKYYSSLTGDDDVISAGMEGLCIAAEKFDPGRGKFSTYAVAVIRNLIRTEIRSRVKHSSVSVSIDNTLEAEDDDTFEKWYGEAEEGYGERELMHDLETMKSVLTEAEILVLNMRIDGRSTKEIVRETGFGMSMVYTTIHKINDLWEKFRGDKHEEIL